MESLNAIDFTPISESEGKPAGAERFGPDGRQGRFLKGPISDDQIDHALEPPAFGV
jgi:hypothetical protein